MQRNVNNKPQTVFWSCDPQVSNTFTQTIIEAASRKLYTLQTLKAHSLSLLHLVQFGFLTIPSTLETVHHRYAKIPCNSILVYYYTGQYKAVSSYGARGGAVTPPPPPHTHT